ncbi:MAG: hypothetical protein ACE14W_05210 [Candidatus Velamenicoccus archaeovorus]
MNGTQVPVRPRFSRGQERRPHSPQEGTPRFSRGQEVEGPSHEKVHEGEFAEGQEEREHHPEGELHGRFSRGQEHGRR